MQHFCRARLVIYVVRSALRAAVPPTPAPARSPTGEAARARALTAEAPLTRLGRGDLSPTGCHVRSLLRAGMLRAEVRYAGAAEAQGLLGERANKVFALF